MKIKRKKNEKKILLVRLSSFGDILLTTHLPRLIKNMYPDYQIDILTSKIFQNIFKFNPYINKIYTFEKKLSVYELQSLNNSLKTNGKYDFVIDLQNNRRSRKIIKKTGENYGKYKKNNWKKFLLVKFKKNYYESIRQVPDLYFDAVNNILKINNDKKGLDFFYAKNYEGRNKENSISTIKKIIIAPGAKHFTKIYPKEKFIELINLINTNYNAEIILMGAKEDIEIANDIEANTRIYKNLVGNTSILETAIIIDEADLLITNDSALMHVAAAVQTKTIAIFGSTVEEFGFFPYQTDFRIAQIELNCRPCTHIGRKSCPKKHFKCMNDISVQMVYNFVIDYLG